MAMEVGLFIAMGVLTLLAAGVLVWGWRGRRVGDHPHCRQCGFDLTGKPEGSGQCGECGADVTKRGAVRIGYRQRRWGWVGVSGVALLVGLGLGVTAGIVKFRQLDLSPWKPTSWLVEDICSGQPQAQQAAWVELNKRLAMPGARASEFVSAADRMLAVQADPLATWDTRMGDFIESLQAAGLLDEERYLRYVRQIPQYRVFCRETVQRGEGLAYRVERATRSGGRTRLYARESTDLLVNGVKVTPLVVVPQGSALYAHASGSSSGVFWTKDNPFKDLPEGALQVTIRLTHEIFERPEQVNHPQARPIVVSVVDEPKTIRLVRSGEDRVEAVKTPGLEEAMRAAFRSLEIVRDPRGRLLVVRFEVLTLPADCAYDVLMVWPGRETRVGDITLFKGRFGVGTQCNLPTDLPPDLPDTVDLIFRPNPDLVRQTVDLHQYADVELRFPGISTTRPSR